MNLRIKILVVEDEKLVYEALRRKLIDSNFDVINAQDGKEALEVALREHPDLILLDIILPVVDGITFLELLRKDFWGAKAKVMILSNLSDASTIKEGKARGVNDYLVKTDWKLDDILIKIKKLFDL